MAFVEDTTTILNSSQIENSFKIAQVLQIRKETEKSIQKYQNICLSLEKILFNNPNSEVELHYIPLSLSKLSEIYKEKEDYNKAFLFMKCSRQFLEYIANERTKAHNSNAREDEEGLQYEEHTLQELFSNMHLAFDAPDALPPKDPQEIIDELLQAKKRQEEEITRQNLEKLKRINEERKKRLSTSKFERFLDFVNNHSIIVVIVIFIFFVIILLISYFYIKRGNSNIQKILQNNKRKHNSNNNKHSNLNYENIKEFRETFRKLNEERKKLKENTEL